MNCLLLVLHRSIRFTVGSIRSPTPYWLFFSVPVEFGEN